jgi:hypothetical protein
MHPLGAATVLVLGLVIAHRAAARAPAPLTTGLLLLVVSVFGFSEPKGVEPLLCEWTGRTLVPQFAAHVAEVASLCLVALVLIWRHFRDPKTPGPRKRVLLCLMAAAVADAAVSVGGMCHFYFGSQISHNPSPAPGAAREAASVWFCGMFQLGMLPLHVLILVVACLRLRKRETRPLPALFAVFAGAGLLYSVLMALLRVDAPWMRLPDSVLDIVLWSLQLLGYGALALAAYIGAENHAHLVRWGQKVL